MHAVALHVRSDFWGATFRQAPRRPLVGRTCQCYRDGDDEKRDHTYRVNIENGVPVACECPSDTYQDGACKHRVAVAIREPVLEAATADDSQDRVATDGGDLVGVGDEGEVLETDDDETNTETEDCACSTLPGEYPCATCYISGAKTWPDEKNDTPRADNQRRSASNSSVGTSYPKKSE